MTLGRSVGALDDPVFGIGHENRAGAGLAGPAADAQARSRSGERCRNWARRGGVVCNYHGGAAPQVKSKARERLQMAADGLTKRLLGFASGDVDAPAYVSLQAVQDALNRAGLQAVSQVEVGIKPYDEVLQDITGIAQISRAESRALRGLPADDPPALADAIDAEAVEIPDQDPSPYPPSGVSRN